MGTHEKRDDTQQHHTLDTWRSAQPKPHPRRKTQTTTMENTALLKSFRWMACCGVLVKVHSCGAAVPPPPTTPQPSNVRAQACFDRCCTPCCRLLMLQTQQKNTPKAPPSSLINSSQPRSPCPDHHTCTHPRVHHSISLHAGIPAPRSSQQPRPNRQKDRKSVV